MVFTKKSLTPDKWKQYEGVVIHKKTLLENVRSLQMVVQL